MENQEEVAALLHAISNKITPLAALLELATLSPTRRSRETMRGWQLPWLRASTLIRTLLDIRWDLDTWPIAEAVLRDALDARSEIQRAGWFN